jgi:hypothetical protein
MHRNNVEQDTGWSYTLRARPRLGFHDEYRIVVYTSAPSVDDLEREKHILEPRPYGQVPPWPCRSKAGFDELPEAHREVAANERAIVWFRTLDSGD